MEEEDNTSFDVHGTLKELYEITNEIVKQSKELKLLRDEKKNKEQQIIEYLKQINNL